MLPPDEPAGRARRRALAWTVAVAVVLLVPLPGLPAGPPGLAALPFDKAAHVLLFLGLTRAWRGARPRSSRLALAAVATGYGGALELLQGALGERTPEWGDLAADAVGALAGAWLPL